MELQGSSPRLINDDLAPATERKWGFKSLFSMWMCDIHSIGGYTFAGGLFALGLSAWGVFGALAVGITIVFFLMNLSGYAGQKLGVPYPVLARLSFGVFGANLPALSRGLIAIAWYGIQTWLASRAVIILAVEVFPQIEDWEKTKFLGESPVGWVAFLLMWAVQLYLLRHGMETIRKFQDWAGPAVWVAMFALTLYILSKSGWHISLSLPGETARFGMTHAFFASIALTVAYFSTLMLNFCDFSRFAPTKKSVWLGNLWGLPVNFLLFSVVTVLVTSGTFQVYGKYIFDPVQVVGQIDNWVILTLGALTFAIATLGINVVANFVSPAYDLANAWPKKIDFKKGGLISAVVALVILPWNLYNTPAIVNTFLGALGAVLGPLFGIIMVDFFVLRKQKVKIEDLYKESGEYYYKRGWNPKALISFFVAFVPAAIFAVVPAGGIDKMIGPFSWFIGAALSAGIHYLISRNDFELANRVKAMTGEQEPVQQQQ